jgi:hypothetical protein
VLLRLHQSSSFGRGPTVVVVGGCVVVVARAVVVGGCVVVVARAVVVVAGVMGAFAVGADVGVGGCAVEVTTGGALSVSTARGVAGAFGRDVVTTGDGVVPRTT